MSERLINSVGLSIVQTSREVPPTIKTHVTTIRKGRKADWIPVPGMCTFLYVDLPHRMTKPQAVEYLTSNENVKRLLKKAGAMDMSFMEEGSRVLLGQGDHVIDDEEEVIENEPTFKKQVKPVKQTKAERNAAVHPNLKQPRRP